MSVPLVLLLASLASRPTAAGLVSPPRPDCAPVSELFALKNLSHLLPPESPQPASDGVCGGGQKGCCSREMEDSLMQTVAQDLHSLLYHSFHSVHGMLASTEAALAEKVRTTSEESENMTLSIFADVYKGMWSDVQGPVRELYSRLVGYVERGRGVPTDLPPAVPSEDHSLLRGYVLDFFRRLFPSVYQETVHSLSDKRSALTEEYSACLANAFADIQPFGFYPDTLAGKVARSFETTKVLFQSLSLGIEVLDSMSSIPENTDSCREALLRLYYCPRCLGLPPRVKPCNGYCLNVMRGCLTQQRTTELDLPWSNFLIEVERLVQQIGDSSEKIPRLDTVLYSFSATVSDAIMVAAINGPTLEKKVQQACGPPKTRLRSSPEPPPAALTVKKKPEEGPVTAQLRRFWQAVEDTKARGFFANLAEALCSDDSFAETRDTADCWNGHRIGEYTKPLVRPGLDAQKYNPELKWTETAADPNIRQLSDKLRHMRQVVLSHFHQDAPALVSFSQTMGSGSGGWSRGWDDTESDDGKEEGSGSGDGATEDDTTNEVDTDHTISQTPKTGTKGKTAAGAGFTINPSLTLLVLIFSMRWIL